MSTKLYARLMLLLCCMSSALTWANQKPLPGDYQPLVTDVDAGFAVQGFITEMVSQHGFERELLENLLVNRPHRADIIQRMQKPAEALPWHSYQKIWMKPERIESGLAFWQSHQQTLKKAQAVYGVDPLIILAILGVETFFGKHLGDYPVVDALYTLGFYYPKRSEFFKSELKHYLLLAKSQGWPLESVKGSYAGAMGMGQFISSSYTNFAVDFDGDGKINLFSSPDDAIGSVANYFKLHGWESSGFIAKPIELTDAQKKLVQTDLKLQYSLVDLKAQAVEVEELLDKTGHAAIFAFEKEPGINQFWLCGNNFYAITRYNHSSLYALAVYQLSEAIRQKITHQETPAA